MVTGVPGQHAAQADDASDTRPNILVFLSDDVRNSVLQIVTPGGREAFRWNSWDWMPLEDCTQYNFPPVHPVYAWVNATDPVGGQIVASFRGCGRVLGIDTATGALVWRIGPSNLSREERGARGVGSPPMPIVGDPEGHFCGQHASQLLPNGNLLMYDNGVVCARNPWTGEFLFRQNNVYSRAVEYALDFDHDEAAFVRDHSLGGTKDRLGYSSGYVAPLQTGDWLISWGNPRARLTPPPYAPDVAVTQVDPDTGGEKFALDIEPDSAAGRLRATVMPAWGLARQPVRLAADFPVSCHTSAFHTGVGGSPQVVAFNQPVVDFDHATGSLEVEGASVASVVPHVSADEPAHAYLIT